MDKTMGYKELIRLSKSCIGEEEKKSVLNVLETEFLGMGPKVMEFEKNLEYNRPYYEGMGLGLFISKTLLENLGATVSFNNEKNKKTGKGAIVTIIFERKKIEVNI